MTSSLPSPAPDAFICPLLKTGRNGCSARFDHALYQLELSQADGSQKKVDLGFSGSRVLERLLLAPGEVVSREELMGYAWENRVVGQGSLSQQIYTLRQLLYDGRNQIIQTLPRRGYLFNPQYLQVDEPTPLALVPPASATEPAVTTRPPVTERPAPEPGPAGHPIPAMQSNRSRTGLWLTGILLVLLTGLGLLGMQLATLSQEPFFTYQRQVGGLEVVYVEGSQRLLDSLISETETAVKTLSTLADKPAQLIVNLSPGFYEIHCLQGESANWLKIHKGQIRTVTSEFLQGCLQ
ncbi:winged helix-turn-helix domain-containing protein [Pseudomonas saudiphocaensis]|uniref:winged helix-turn-helix domain-containing protein n=1 Tax=Pseudomonas saudiphocaensis TaxID=1499686 RepID=UPI00187D63E8|nr:winged helix-turn-helix domain-containing protein [Pseudomonas saudiphocaensis]MBE7928130.1 winged helix-turn-helix domain-containing protein [Pseudomonas saudiphocaensis]